MADEPLQFAPEIKTHRHTSGKPTQPEIDLVAQFLRDQPYDVTRSQARGLSKALRRTPEMTAKIITEARAKLADTASEYVDIHLTAARLALMKGDALTAGKLSEWAIERISEGNQRVIEHPSAVPMSTAPRILIGVQLGGLGHDQARAVQVLAHEEAAVAEGEVISPDAPTDIPPTHPWF